MFFAVADFYANNDIAADVGSYLFLFRLFFNAARQHNPTTTTTTATSTTVVGSAFGTWGSGGGGKGRRRRRLASRIFFDTVWPRVGFPFLRH